MRINNWLSESKVIVASTWQHIVIPVQPITGINRILLSFTDGFLAKGFQIETEFPFWCVESFNLKAISSNLQVSCKFLENFEWTSLTHRATEPVNDLGNRHRCSFSWTSYFRTSESEDSSYKRLSMRTSHHPSSLFDRELSSNYQWWAGVIDAWLLLPPKNDRWARETKKQFVHKTAHESDESVGV